MSQEQADCNLEVLTGKEVEIWRRRTKRNFGVDEGLAKALDYHANSLSIANRLAEADAAPRESVEIRRHLCEQQGGARLAVDLAVTLDNYGWVLYGRNQTRQAEESSSGAIAVCRSALQTDDCPDVQSALAMRLNNHGVLLGKLGGRAAQAERSLAESVAIRRHLLDAQGGAELARQLARSLCNRALALKDLDRFAEAEGSSREAVSLYLGLHEREEGADLAADLAAAQLGLCIVLLNLGRPSESVACSREAVAICRHLVERIEREDREDLVDDLARACVCAERAGAEPAQP